VSCGAPVNFLVKFVDLFDSVRFVAVDWVGGRGRGRGRGVEVEEDEERKEKKKKRQR
jgi:hypothetical protein